jgi:hypothetical protein
VSFPRAGPIAAAEAGSCEQGLLFMTKPSLIILWLTAITFAAWLLNDGQNGAAAALLAVALSWEALSWAFGRHVHH